MTLWLIFFAPLIFLVAGWAWRFQHQVLAVTGTGVARIAGRPGALSDVQLTSVLVDGARILVGFRAAGNRRSMRMPPRPSPGESHRQFLLAVDADAQVSLARLHRWEASGTPLVLWCDHAGDRVELSHPRTGLQVSFAVVAQPSVTASSLFRCQGAADRFRIGLVSPPTDCASRLPSGRRRAVDR